MNLNDLKHKYGCSSNTFSNTFNFYVSQHKFVLGFTNDSGKDGMGGIGEMRFTNIDFDELYQDINAYITEHSLSFSFVFNTESPFILNQCKNTHGLDKLFDMNTSKDQSEVTYVDIQLLECSGTISGEVFNALSEATGGDSFYFENRHNSLTVRGNINEIFSMTIAGAKISFTEEIIVNETFGIVGMDSVGVLERNNIKFKEAYLTLTKHEHIDVKSIMEVGHRFSNQAVINEFTIYPEYTKIPIPIVVQIVRTMILDPKITFKNLLIYGKYNSRTDATKIAEFYRTHKNTNQCSIADLVKLTKQLSVK